MLIDLDEVGAFPSSGPGNALTVRFGIYLLGVRYPEGYRLQVIVIHQSDQFVRDVPPRSFWLDWEENSTLDLWRKTVVLAGGPGHFGEYGTYLYRFQVLREDAAGAVPVTPQFADPFGRSAGRGGLSAFSVNPGPAEAASWSDTNFTVPEVDDMVVYELHVGDLNATFDGVVDQLAYLTGLGVNVLEVMPITNVEEDIEWGLPTRLLRPRGPLRGH